MSFNLFHAILAVACLALGRWKPGLKAAATGSAVLYICTIVIDHGLFDTPNTDYNRYFITYALFDLAWGIFMIACRCYYAAVIMALFFSVELLTLYDGASVFYHQYEIIMVFLNMAFMLCLYLDNRFQTWNLVKYSDE